MRERKGERGIERQVGLELKTMYKIELKAKAYLIR